MNKSLISLALVLAAAPTPSNQRVEPGARQTPSSQPLAARLSDSEPSNSRDSAVVGQDTGPGPARVGPRGLLVDDRDEPVPAARVTLHWHGPDRGIAVQLTNVEGGFAFAEFAPEGVTDRTCRLSVSTSEHGWTEQTIPCNADGIVVKLEAYGQISGLARLADGGEATGLTVQLARGIAGAKPTSWTQPGRDDLIAGDDGSFSVRRVKRGVWDLIVGARGHRAEVVPNVSVMAGEVTAIPEVVLTRGRALEGRVVSHDGVPLAAATVVAEDPAAPSLINDRTIWIPGGHSLLSVQRKTDEEGQFRLEGIGPDFAALVVFHPEYAPTRLERLPNVRDLGEELTIRLGTGGSIEGRVAGAPDARLRVTVTTDRIGRETSVDAEGRFRVDRLAPGNYSVSLVGLPNSDQRRQEVAVVDGETTRIEFVTRTATRVTGTVRREHVAGVAFVRFAPARGAGDAPQFATRSTVADPDGGYVLDAVMPGRYEVRVCPGGDDPFHCKGGWSKFHRDVPDVEKVQLDFDVVGVRIAGRVIDQETGQPVASGSVTVLSRHPSWNLRRVPADSVSAQTDALGRFELITPPGDGTLQLLVIAWSHAPHTVSIDPTRSDDLEIPIARGERMMLRPIDADGNPMTNVTVIPVLPLAPAFSSGDNHRIAFPVAGTAVVDLLLLGSGGQCSFHPAVPVGTEVTLVVQPGCQLELSVDGLGGEPPSIELVDSLGRDLAFDVLERQANVEQLRELRRTGRCLLSGLPAGAFDLVVRAGDLEARQSIPLTAGQVTAAKVMLRPTVGR